MDLLEHYRDVERKVRHMKDIERAGDELTHNIYDALNRSFVTPFDRDDIGRLASALDDVLDWTEEAARRLQIYKIEEPTELAKKFARVILDQAEVIQKAVPMLENLRNAELM
jgi:hypothetical protein